MGIFGGFRAGRNALRPDYLAAGIASPFSESTLSQIVLSDVFPTIPELPLTRGDAQSIPAVAKAVGLISAAIVKAPLRALNSTGPLSTQPAWISRTDGIYSPVWRNVKTFEDLAYDGVALWTVKRGSEGQILTADRCAPERWNYSDETGMRIDEQKVSDEEFVVIPSLRPPLLTSGARTLRGARDIEQAWVSRARTPIPGLELHMTDEGELTREEVQDVVTEWSKARRSIDGATGFTPKGIEVRTHGEVSADLFIEGRNGIRTDVGSFFGIPSTEMDASLATASLTYSTTEGNRSKFIESCLPLWLGAIESRLSQDDVVPAGSRVRFDMSALTGTEQLPTGLPVED